MTPVFQYIGLSAVIVLLGNCIHCCV